MSLVYNYLYIDLPESVQVCYQTDTELNNIWLSDISTQTVWYQIDIELTNTCIWLPKVKNKGLTSQQCFKIGCWYIDILILLIYLTDLKGISLFLFVQIK